MSHCFQTQSAAGRCVTISQSDRLGRGYLGGAEFGIYCGRQAKTRPKYYIWQVGVVVENAGC